MTWTSPGKRVFVLDLNVPLDGADDHRRRTDSGQPADDSCAARPRRARSSCARTWGVPRVRPNPELSLQPGGAAGWPSCSTQPVRFVRRRTVGARAELSWHAAWRRRDRAAGERPVRPARDQQGRRRTSGARQEYAGIADVFVSDGFGVVHRKQASVYDVARLLPHAAGELVGAEVAVLQRLTADPARPYVVVLGGSKVSDKLAVIENLLDRVDRLLIGGGMVYTFLAAAAGRSARRCSRPTRSTPSPSLMKRAERRGVEIVLPTDIVVADRFAADAEPSVVPADAIPDDRDGSGHRS